MYDSKGIQSVWGRAPDKSDSSHTSYAVSLHVCCNHLFESATSQVVTAPNGQFFFSSGKERN